MYGILDSGADNRDYVYANICGLGRDNLPSSFSNTEKFIFDQKNTMKCGGTSGSSYMELIDMARNNTKDVKKLSAQFLYYNAKRLDGLNSSVVGTTPKAICESALKYGICTEELALFKEDGDLLSTMKSPTQQAYADAEKRKIGGFARLYTLDDMKRAIILNHGFLLSLLYYSKMFNPTEKGFIDKPHWQDKKMGLHLVLAKGYDDNYEKVINGIKRKGFIEIQNSFGKEHGLNGIDYIPYDFILDNWCGGQYGYTNDKIFREALTWYDETNVKNNQFHILNQPQYVVKRAKKIHMEIKLGSNKALVNGNNITLDQPMIEKGGYMFAPVRFFAEALDCDVFYKDMCGRAFTRLTDKNTGMNVDLTEGWNYNYVDGKEYYCVQPPFVDSKTDRMLLGLRDICTMFGCDVKWNKTTRIATITR